MFPLEPVGIFVDNQKMTLDTGDHIRFWAHRRLAPIYFHKHKVLSTRQFDQVNWKSVHSTLHGLSRLFQLWASKHVLGVAGTMMFLSHQDDRSPLCPSCGACNKSCRHVSCCPEAGRTDAFVQSTQEVEQWLEKHNTPPDLAHLLSDYLRGRGNTTCLECATNLNLPPIYVTFAKLQDVIGWDGYIMGMVSQALLPLYSTISHTSNLAPSAARWITGLITQLLQVTHTQWIYRCVLVHDQATGTLISAHKEELLKEIERQLSLGPEGLNEQDRFLLECNFDDLANSSGKNQAYWLLAIIAAHEASRLCREVRTEEL